MVGRLSSKVLVSGRSDRFIYSFIEFPYLICEIFLINKNWTSFFFNFFTFQDKKEFLRRDIVIE